MSPAFDQRSPDLHIPDPVELIDAVGEELWSHGLSRGLRCLSERLGASVAVLRLERAGSPLEWIEHSGEPSLAREAVRRARSLTASDGDRGSTFQATNGTASTQRIVKVFIEGQTPAIELELFGPEGLALPAAQIRALRSLARQFAAHAMLASERRQSRECDDFLRDVAEEGPTIKHVYLPGEGRTVFANTACRRFLDESDLEPSATSGTLSDRHVWLRHVHPDDARLLRRQLVQTERDGIGRRLVGHYRFLRGDVLVHLQVWSTRLPDHRTADQDAVLVTAIDESDTWKLRAHVTRLRSSEKSELRRMIHDGICQDLIGLRMSLERVLDDRDALSDPARSELESLRGAIARSLHDAREISRGIGPFTLDRRNLYTTLRDVLESTESRFGVRCVLDVRGRAPSSLGGEDAAQLYWIARESVSNAAKHAEASSIRVSFETDGRQLTLCVRDDGKGFDPGAISKGTGRTGQGLSILNQRAEMIDASLTIDTALGEGTAITCTLDLEETGERDDS